MDAHEPFLSEEFFRYSAECRRLARLARKPPGRSQQGRGTAAYSRFIEWVGEVQARYSSPPEYRPQLVVRRPLYR
jgi:hypothetical protein